MKCHPVDYTLFRLVYILYNFEYVVCYNLVASFMSTRHWLTCENGVCYFFYMLLSLHKAPKALCSVRITYTLYHLMFALS